MYQRDDMGLDACPGNGQRAEPVHMADGGRIRSKAIRDESSLPTGSSTVVFFLVGCSLMERLFCQGTTYVTWA